jgi:hypothetical protein
MGASPVSKKTLGDRRGRGINRSGDSRFHHSVDTGKGPGMRGEYIRPYGACKSPSQESKKRRA